MEGGLEAYEKVERRRKASRGTGDSHSIERVKSFLSGKIGEAV